MSFRFNPSGGPIIVRASVAGPQGRAEIRVVLDTGATTSLIRTPILTAIGYDPDRADHAVRIAMASGVETVPRITLDRFAALGRNRLAFPVLAHPLVSAVQVDGLLGLDFLRDQTISIDFPSGIINLI